jgi:hypothetical protein
LKSNTTDFHAYRLVRVEGQFTWTNLGASGEFDTGVGLVETVAR